MPTIPMPEPLAKFYEAEHGMLQFYDAEIRGGGRCYVKEKMVIAGAAAVGLSCWFKRWVKACKGHQASRPRPPRHVASRPPSANNAVEEAAPAPRLP